MNKPSKLDTFMYALMKEAQRYDFSEFIEEWEIENFEYEEIESWFRKELNIKL